ncbi:MAG: porphobilinogen synthase [candidate division WOR-3 bacterium]
MKNMRRPRRMRVKDSLRELVRETRLSVENLVYPIFVLPYEEAKEPIDSMPGQFRLGYRNLLEEIKEIKELGIKAVLLFGIPKEKDEFGSYAYDENGVVQNAIKIIKDKFPEITIITDVCLCSYTTHGHCGIVKDGKVLNDETLEILSKVAISHARAGADIVAPSAMMDHQVRAIRNALDSEGYIDVGIMSYSAKFFSSFYGPFRQAADSSPKFGNRSSYQMDYANAREAIVEVEMDILEGADIVMVKPALSYLDIIHVISKKFNVPIAAYNVSGEYAMIKSASEKGWINEKDIVIEILTSIKRAGANIIITYFAKEVSKWIRNF